MSKALKQYEVIVTVDGGPPAPVTVWAMGLKWAREAAEAWARDDHPTASRIVAR